MRLKDRLRRFTPAPILDFKRSIHQRLSKERDRGDPVITRSRGNQSLSAAHTAVIICGPYFDQRVPTAGVTYRMGLARGFEQVGIPYELVSLFNLQRLRDLAEPIVFLSEWDYQFVSKAELRELRRYRKFVWVSPWFQGAAKFYEEHNLDDLEVTPERVRARVLESEPAFVFTPVSQWGLEYYSGWEKHGQRLISLPLACDISLYDRRVAPPKFADVQMAFVGGYWPYKARSFDLYLKPHEQKLTVFGYSQWPYAGYGGQLSEEDEPLLYRDATLSPAINEPHAPILGGDVCERVYKVLGSGGLCVTDITAAHRDLFTPEELLVPESVDDYHDIVNAIFREPERFDIYRENGYRAIRARHTYMNRATTIMENLGLPIPHISSALATVA